MASNDNGTAVPAPEAATTAVSPAAPIPDLLSDPTPTAAAVPAAQASILGGNPGEPPPDAAKAGTGGFRSSIMAAARKAPMAGPSKKKHVTYGQLARGLKQLAQTPEQKKAQQQMVALIFPKLAVYNSVDPALGPSLLNLLQNCNDVGALRYSYYFLSRILSESGEPKNAPGGSVPTPNWDSLAAMATGGAPPLTRGDVVPQILSRLVTEASTTDLAAHPRRVAALKSLVCMPLDNNEAFDALVKIIIQILDKGVADRKQRRRRTSLFRRGSQDKEGAIRGNLSLAALSALRRLPMDPMNDSLIERVVIGIGCPDPVGVRHALAMVAEMALSNPVGVATSLARLAGGSIAEALRLSDVFARVYLARLCGILIHSSQLYERPDLRGLFSAILFQSIYDPSDKVALEVITHLAGSINGQGSGDQRADGWQILTTSFTEGRPATKDEKKVPKGQEPPRGKPELLLKVVVDRLDFALRSSSRPLLHAALRTVGELGKSRAAAQSLGLVGDDEVETPEDDVLDFAEAMGRVAPKESNTVSIEALLGTLMEAVRVVAACECVYVRAQALKAMIWMQSELESAEELTSTLEGELGDPSWPPSTLNELLQTLHLRFKVSPGMAVMLLDLANVFVTRVPAKVDTASIQALWKMCLVGCGAEGKHLALEAVSAVLDRPPPPPPPRNGETLTLTLTLNGGAASDPRSATALQRLLQSAIWFLGENANYAAAEYAWEGATPPAAALMMLDTERMVAASGIRNPTLAAAITRLQRCIAAGSWEERVVAAHALITIAIRSGEPYRLQIYEFFHALLYGGGAAKDKVHGTGAGVSNGEDRGATGTGLQSVVSPMLRVLDEMYQAQDVMMKDIRQHDFSKEEWKEEDLKKIYEMHERLMDLTLLFCYVPRSRYLPLGPVSAPLIQRYRDMKGVSPDDAPNDEAIKESLTKLLAHGGAPKVTPDFPPVTLLEPMMDEAPGLDSMRRAGEEGDGEEATPYAMAMNFDEIWARSLVEADEDQTDGSQGSDSPRGSFSDGGAGNLRSWDEESISGIVNPGAQTLNAPMRSDSPSLSRDESYSQREDDYDVDKLGTGASFSEGYNEEELRQSMEGAELRVGKAMYAFVGQDEDELTLAVGDEVEIEYEVDGWLHVRKKEPGPDGKMVGLVPAMYVR